MAQNAKKMQVSLPGHAMHAIPFWDELRTWDPGDYTGALLADLLGQLLELPQ
jgi:hypothetical protein